MTLICFLLLAIAHVSTAIDSVNSRRLLSADITDNTADWTAKVQMINTRTMKQSAVFHYDGIIYILGGYPQTESKYVTKWDMNTNTFTDEKVDKLPYAVYGYAHFYTQIGSKGYVLSDYNVDTGNTHVYVYDLTQDLSSGSIAANSVTVLTTPIDYAGSMACLTADETNNMLYVVGGWDNQEDTANECGSYSCDANALQVYSLAAQQWLTGSTPYTNGQWYPIGSPPLDRGRNRHACAVADGHLYAIGGKNLRDLNSYQDYLINIEYISTTNILSNRWAYSNAVMAPLPERGLGFFRTVVIDDTYIVCVGGGGKQGILKNSKSVEIIDVSNGPLSAVVSDGAPMIQEVQNPAVIMVDHAIYAFGGTDNMGRLIDDYQYIQLSTDAPSKQPSTSPTQFPSRSPTETPVKQPSTNPSRSPTKNPLPPTYPTKNPTLNPTMAPSQPTVTPSESVDVDSQGIGAVNDSTYSFIFLVFLIVFGLSS